MENIMRIVLVFLIAILEKMIQKGMIQYSLTVWISRYLLNIIITLCHVGLILFWFLMLFSTTPWLFTKFPTRY